jgi:hypothetical protein
MDHNPHKIREVTVNRMHKERLQLVQYVQNIIDSEMKNINYHQTWKKVFTNKLGFRTKFPIGKWNRVLTERSPILI